MLKENKESNLCFFFFSSRRRHTSSLRDWSSDVCSSDLAGRDCDRSSHTSCGRGRCRNTAARRFVDADRGVIGGGHRAVEHPLAGWRSAGSYPVGNPRCRAGTAWAWGLVGRCSPFWMEANRHSRPEELAFTHLYLPHPFDGIPWSKGAAGVPQESAYGVPK